MKRSTTIVLAATAVLVLGGGTIAMRSVRGATDNGGGGSVRVARGVLVDRALAIGTIQPDVEVSVKSKISGVVQRRFAEPGDFVRAGAPLLEIRPDPTPLELAEARRQVELRELDAANLKKELDRNEELRKRELLAPQAYDASRRSYEEAVVQLQMAREKLQLLEKGHVTIANSAIESVVRSPIDGYVLEKKVEVGDPVVPLSTYQEGTVLLTMADMGHLLFRGTVDEIDVGRLKEGMPVEIKIGALPDARISGVLSKISLKAQKEDNATTFPVEVRLQRAEGVTLRAGYSANAEIIIRRKEGVLQVPERTVTFEGDSAWVNVPGADAKPRKQYIRTGLSDAINVEVVSGLRDGDRVLEKPTKDVK
jgi:HlyD family secretion protein